MRSFDFLKAFFGPFKRPRLKLYFGPISIGVPYFLPRKWIKTPNGSVSKSVKYLYVNFATLGFKTKWTPEDFRFEWNPILSLVILNKQIALMVIPDHCSHYWESWLFYEYATDKNLSVIDRLKYAREKFPNTWISNENGIETKTCYWDLILKEKFLKI